MKWRIFKSRSAMSMLGALAMLGIGGCGDPGLDNANDDLAEVDDVRGGVLDLHAGEPAGIWRTYTDPRFDFSMDYPEEWNLRERLDRPGSIGEVLTITSPRREPRYSVQIGHYLYEIGADESLAAWERRIPSIFDESERRSTVESDLAINGSEVRYIRGRSPLTEYQYVTVRHGSLVWFVWANWGDSADDFHGQTFRRIASSFRVGLTTPRSLRGILGTPALTGRTSVEGILPVVPQADLTSNWWSPLLGNAANPQWPVTCGSTAHTAGAKYAADITAPYGYQTLAARSGEVDFAGWDNYGYGNALKIGPVDDAGNRHLYAHLQAIFWPMLTIDYRVTQGETVGWVGDSGSTFGTHLHFHVQSGLSQSSSTGVDLRGMYGFTDNPNDSWYPSSDGMSHYNCAWMGR